MFEFDKQYQEAVKKIEQFVDHARQANEFWISSVLSSLKSFYKTK